MMAITHAEIAPLEQLQQAYPGADIFLKVDIKISQLPYLSCNWRKKFRRGNINSRAAN